MEFDETGIGFQPIKDARPLLPEPPPVRLTAIEDVHVPMEGWTAGGEKALDAFYIALLKFVREDSEAGHIIYKSETRRLRFDVREPPIVRRDLRPMGIDVPSLILFERELIDREIEYQRQKGLVAGQDTLLLQDPAGNWLLVGQFVRV